MSFGDRNPINPPKSNFNPEVSILKKTTDRIYPVNLQFKSELFKQVKTKQAQSTSRHEPNTEIKL